MRYLFLFCCFVLGLYGTAQTPSDPQLVDVVEVKGEPDLSGTLIGYDYGVSVTIVTTVGEVVTVGWQRVRRVIIQGETVRPIEEELPWVLTDTLEVLPERSFRHQLLTTTGISRERNQNFNNFFGDSHVAVLGPGINYHFVYATGKLLVGPGVGYEVM
ncbi:MAG: hypothetical protein WA952_07605, partial [Lewinella sp.]